MSEEKEVKQKKKGKGLLIAIILIILAILVGGGAAAVYYLKFAAQEVDLSQYISLDMDGKYNEYASFTEDDIIINEKKLKSDLDDSSLAKKLIAKIEKKAELEDSEDLSNGDTVTIKINIKEDWLKENRLKLKSNKVEIKLKDLEDAEAIDLFEGLKINYYGISPFIEITDIQPGDDLDKSIKNNVSFTAYDEDGEEIQTYDDYLKNGDTITIKADYKESTIQEKGYTVAKDKKDFEVKDQPYYITTKDELTGVQDIVTAFLKEKANYELDNFANIDATYVLSDDYVRTYSESFTASDPTLVNLYLFVEKDIGESYSYKTHNYVCAIFKTDFTDTVGGATFTGYYAVYANDVAINNGEIDSDYTYGPYISYNPYKTAAEAYDEDILEYETNDYEKITIQ